MALASLVLLALSTALLVVTAQSYLQITIDASEVDWKPSGWTSPGGTGCPVPGTDYTVWRCCVTTETPTQCQLIWNDANDRTAEDIYYARLYLNQTGLYFFARADMYLQKDVILWLNTSTYTLRINITGKAPTPRSRLDCSGDVKEYSAGQTRIDPTITGVRIERNIEAYVPFSTIFGDTSCAAVQDGAYDISIKFEGDTMTVVSRTGVSIVTIVVSNYYIVDAYYVMSGTRTPIPVPEPGIFVVASVITSTIVLGVVFFTRRSSV